MVEIKAWMDRLSGQLRNRFDSRLLFLGLQGSYGRGEATEESDIDVVTVLDRVELQDLDAYRAIVRQMPEGEKACGFLCGGAELKSWPKYDLLSMVQDTRAVYGTLEALVPPMGRKELAQGAAIGASGLYHAAVHTYLYESREQWPVFLNGAEKSAFFVLRALYELRCGDRVRTRRELASQLKGDERALLSPDAGEDMEARFARLIRWSGAVMAEAREPSPARGSTQTGAVRISC